MDLRCTRRTIAPLVASSDRTEADRDNDKKRKPIELLEFIAPKTGWRVLDLAAGAGYSTELLARAVSPDGKVLAQHTKASEKFSERKKLPAMANVVDVISPFDELSHPEIRDLDLVTFLFGYHDTTFLGVDRSPNGQSHFQTLLSTEEFWSSQITRQSLRMVRWSAKPFIGSQRIPLKLRSSCRLRFCRRGKFPTSPRRRPYQRHLQQPNTRR